MQHESGPPILDVPVGTLRAYMDEMLRAAGCDEHNARIAAECFLAADLRGVGLQGLDHMPTLLDGLREGRVDGRARPRVVEESGAIVRIDGGGGPGQAAALLGVDRAVERARLQGCCVTAIGNSFDVFMLGYFTERIALAGCVAIGFSDAPPMVRAHGGIEPRLGTNPLSIAVPTHADPVVVDLATSALSASRVRQALYHGETVAEARGMDGQGRPSADPAAVRAGAIGPLAGHKGFGLGLCVALLSGPLTGSDTGQALAAAHRVAGKGHLFVAIDPAALGDRDAFLAATRAYLDEVRASTPEDPAHPVRIPGERGAAARREALSKGTVPVYASVWNRMAEVAVSLGVTPPATPSVLPPGPP